MIDELLTTFRGEIPEPDRDTARRIYVLATRNRRPRKPHRRFALGFAVAVLVLVPTGVAFGGKLASLFEGTPAPPDISTSFGTFNQMADLSVQQGFADRWPQVDVTKAHGVIEVQTPDGPEDMWAAPNDQGGQCWLIDFANDPVGHDGAREFDGGCDRQAPSPGDIAFGDFWTYQHPDLKTVYGSVRVDSATVRVDYDDGSAATLPVVEHLFLTSTPKDVKAESVTAFDAAGNQVAEFSSTHG